MKNKEVIHSVIFLNTLNFVLTYNKIIFKHILMQMKGK